MALANISKVLFDLVALTILLIAWLLMYIIMPVSKNGFLCNDYSISMPYKSPTVSDTMLVLICLITPIVLICSTEIIQAFYQLSKGREQFMYKIKVCKNIVINVPEVLGNIYINIVTCAFGQFVVNFLSEYTKYRVGRLRPHYLDICKPKFFSNSMNETRLDCKYKEYFQYDVDYVCTGTNAKRFRDAHLSFPSGHASGTFYSMVFLILYIQYTWKYSRFGLLKPLAQVCLFLIAYYTSLTRIFDNMHHFSDVLAGAILGIIFGVFIFFANTNLLKKPNIYSALNTKFSCCYHSNDVSKSSNGSY